MNDVPQNEAEDWWESQRYDRAAKAIKEAQRAYGKASLLSDVQDPDAEGEARRLLRLAAEAFWYSEGTDLEEPAHEKMDFYGRWVREHFGCVLSFRKGAYYQECPVAIAHKRLGVSIGFTAKKTICSICAEDVVDCVHLPSELYDVPGGSGPAGLCRVCGSSDCKQHLPGYIYRAAPVSIVTEIARLHEVSFVRRPAQPLARPTSIPVDMDGLRESAGGNFRHGSHLSCDRCLQPCRGIEEVPRLDR